MKTSHILVSGTVMALSLLIAPLAQAHPGDNYRDRDRHYRDYDHHRHQQYQRSYHRAPPSRVMVVTPAPSRYYETREVYRYNDYSYNTPYRGKEKNRFSITYSGNW